MIWVEDLEGEYGLSEVRWYGHQSHKYTINDLRATVHKPASPTTAAHHAYIVGVGYGVTDSGYLDCTVLDAYTPQHTSLEDANIAAAYCLMWALEYLEKENETS